MGKELKPLMSRVSDERALEILEQAKLDPKMINADNHEKTYVVLYYATDDTTGEELKSWEILKGRQKVYDFIKSMKDYMNMDDSIVLVEGQNVETAKSCYDFVEFVTRNSYVKEDTTFHIEEYHTGE